MITSKMFRANHPCRVTVHLSSYLAQYADILGLDVDRFRREMNEHVYADRVREDFRSGVRSGVNGMPTFFINGARHDDSWDVDTLLEAIERAGIS